MNDCNFAKTMKKLAKKKDASSFLHRSFAMQNFQMKSFPVVLNNDTKHRCGVLLTPDCI